MARGPARRERARVPSREGRSRLRAAPPRFGLTALVLLLAALGGSASAADPREASLQALGRSPKLGAGVVERLRREPRVRALVYFEAGESRGSARRARIQGLRDELERSGRAAGELKVLRRFGVLSALALEADPAALERLAAHPAVLRIDPERPGGGSLNQARPLADVDEVQADSFLGTGVKVAVLDSGWASQHADLAGSAVGEACFCSGGCCPSGASQQLGAGAAEDDHGHGTNVTGIVTATGTWRRSEPRPPRASSRSRCSITTTASAAAPTSPRVSTGCSSSTPTPTW